MNIDKPLTVKPISTCMYELHNINVFCRNYYIYVLQSVILKIT